jgi:asparagine synthase (glutamine-hydrolysing)
MCGVAGILGFRDKKAATAQIRIMRDAMKHRGPDGEGLWISDKHALGFGHQRLAVIDLSESASQPMVSHDGKFVITYNGEIYNYRELRKECEQMGSVFRSQSDTEVIIESYRHWDTDIFKLFSGMWALAIYDRIERRVIFSRDPFGIKPLYYGFCGGALYFASEPKALRAVEEEFSNIDEITVRLFEEYGYLDRGDWTFFKRIKRFPHAHYAIVELEDSSYKLDLRRYWLAPPVEKSIGMQDAAAEVKRLLERSVELHLRSDVPVGSCLSGGLDSSSIVCIGTTLLPKGSRFNTFTTRYPEYLEIDETRWAQKVIDFTNARARYTEPTFESFMTDFDHLVYAQDEPFGSTSIYAQYSIFKRISETDVKVVLDGQGADEQLAGYHGFFDQYMTYLAEANRWMTYFVEGLHLRKLYNYAFKSHFKAMFYNMRKRLLEFGNSKKTDRGMRESLCVDELELRINEMTLPEEDFEKVLTNLLVETNIPQLLRYEDRNSMAFSIESRVPFLEPNLVNFLLTLPADLKINRGLTKAVFREALKGIVPEEVRLRTDKLGFPAPEKSWLKRGFGIDVEGPGELKWRKTVTSRWRQMILRKAAC